MHSSEEIIQSSDEGIVHAITKVVGNMSRHLHHFKDEIMSEYRSRQEILGKAGIEMRLKDVSPPSEYLNMGLKPPYTPVHWEQMVLLDEMREKRIDQLIQLALNEGKII